MRKTKLVSILVGKIILVCLIIGIIFSGLLCTANAQGVTITSCDFGCPSTIKVLRTATGEIEEIDFKDYVKNVLPNEWIASWDMDALKAGVIAVKNYGWYRTIHPKYPGEGYDVRDDTGDQVYKSGSSHQRTNQAIDEIWNYYIEKNGEIFYSQYDSGTPGSSEPLYEGRMSQHGTQYWAEQGYDWQWITHYYYDPVGPIGIVPELPTVVLFSVALIVLAGFAWLNSRRSKER